MGNVIHLPVTAIKQCPDADPLNVAGNFTADIDFSDLLVTAASVDEVSMPTANNNYTYVLPAGTKRYLIQLKEHGNMLLNWGTATGTKDIEIPRGADHHISFIDPAASITLNFQSDKPNDTARIVTWS